MPAQDKPNGRDRHTIWWNPEPGIDSTDRGAAPYRRLALQLHHDLTPQGTSRSILVATPNRSQLPAHASISMAYCLAEELHLTALLIDACATEPELSRALGCVDARGFSDLLENPEQMLEQFVLPTTHPRVWFLPAGTRRGTATAQSPESVRKVIASAESRYGFIVLSGGSVLNDTAALAITPHVGCVLLLPVENETLVGDLDAAQKTLRICKARKIGIMMVEPARAQR